MNGVCLSSLETVGLGRQTLPCGHVLHEQCITDMRRYGASGRCPLCRQVHGDLTPVQELIDEAALRFKQCAYDECHRVISFHLGHASFHNFGDVWGHFERVPFSENSHVGTHAISFTLTSSIASYHLM